MTSGTSGPCLARGFERDRAPAALRYGMALGTCRYCGFDPAMAYDEVDEPEGRAVSRAEESML